MSDVKPIGQTCSVETALITTLKVAFIVSTVAAAILAGFLFIGHYKALTSYFALTTVSAVFTGAIAKFLDSSKRPKPTEQTSESKSQPRSTHILPPLPQPKIEDADDQTFVDITKEELKTSYVSFSALPFVANYQDKQLECGTLKYCQKLKDASSFPSVMSKIKNAYTLIFDARNMDKETVNIMFHTFFFPEFDNKTDETIKPEICIISYEEAQFSHESSFQTEKVQIHPVEGTAAFSPDRPRKELAAKALHYAFYVAAKHEGKEVAAFIVGLLTEEGFKEYKRGTLPYFAC